MLIHALSGRPKRLAIAERLGNRSNDAAYSIGANDSHRSSVAGRNAIAADERRGVPWLSSSHHRRSVEPVQCR
jgi:hypothetical protein